MPTRSDARCATIEAYGGFLSRNGNKDEALEIYRGVRQAPAAHHPVIVEEATQVAAGEKLPPLVDTAQAGAAEALYGLGAALGRREAADRDRGAGLSPACALPRAEPPAGDAVARRSRTRR